MVHAGIFHSAMFHHFHGLRHAEVQGSISSEQFASVLEAYGPERLISADEGLERCRAGRLQPNDVCVSFDDGLLCQYDVALPILKAYGIRGFFFVYSNVLVGGIGRLDLYRKFRMECFDSVDMFYEAFFQCVDQSEYRTCFRKAPSDICPKKYLKAFLFYTEADKKFRFARDAILGSDRYHQIMDFMIEDREIDVKAFTSNIWMTQDHLRKLHADGHLVGLHSHTRPTALAELSREEQEHEYQMNFQILWDPLGHAERSPYTRSALRPFSGWNEP